MSTSQQAAILTDGEEIAEGRSIVRHIETGDPYATYLVWDEHRFTLAVAKLLRSDRLEEQGARRALVREAGALERPPTRGGIAEIGARRRERFET